MQQQHETIRISVIESVKSRAIFGIKNNFQIETYIH